jgi:3-deoxy-D-manno-octulosonic-acid transferase
LTHSLSAFLYQLSIRSYAFLMRIAAFFHPKARLWVQGRQNLLPRLASELPALIRERPVAWFHAASLGEFEQGRPVIEAFRSQYPDYFIFLTFFSPSGYEVRKNYAQADYITYLPTDTPANARELIGLLRPRVVFFIKYEFWYNYLRELRRREVIILSFSAIFRPGQLFFRSYGSFYQKLLRYFDHILVQNEESLHLLRTIPLHNVTLAGDTRFDRVIQIAEVSRELPEIAAFVGNSLCIVIGSAWNADREVLVPALNNQQQPFQGIIAPHEIQEPELLRWEQELQGGTLRYSAYRAAGFDLSAFPKARYLLIDNMGMLSSLYRYGQIAYIGGALGSGLHNILEAATFGLPVLFGNKNYRKFQEAVELIDQEGAWAIGNSRELSEKLSELLADPALCHRQGAVSRAYVEAHTGATQAVMQCLEEYMNSN